MTHGPWEHILESKEINCCGKLKNSKNIKSKSFKRRSRHQTQPGNLIFFCGIILKFLKLTSSKNSMVALLVMQKASSWPQMVIYWKKLTQGSVWHWLLLENNDLDFVSSKNIKINSRTPMFYVCTEVTSNIPRQK